MSDSAPVAACVSVFLCLRVCDTVCLLCVFVLCIIVVINVAYFVEHECIRSLHHAACSSHTTPARNVRFTELDI